MTVHGDDFTVTGPDRSLRWLRKAMEHQYEITTHVLGPGRDEEQEIRVLNRTICWETDCITYEPDQRHAEIIINEMGRDSASSKQQQQRKGAIATCSWYAMEAESGDRPHSA